MQIKIERANIKQLDNIAFLFDRYRIFYRQDSDINAAKDFVRARLQQQDAVIFITIENNKPLGYTQLFSSWSSVSMQRVWILNDLFVLPEHRNKGIATALINKANEYAISTDAARIVLATETTNKNAQKLYKSLGYSLFHDFYHYVFSISP